MVNWSLKLEHSEEHKLTLDDCVFHKDSDRESIMQLVESIRSHWIYPHLKCTTECKERGKYNCECMCVCVCE